MNTNPFFILSSFIVVDMPEPLTEDYADLLSDMDDPYEISFFCRKYPNHNIQFNLISEETDIKYYSASVDYSDYLNWTEEMKKYWSPEGENEYFRKYQINSNEEGLTLVRYKFKYEGIEMKSLIIDPKSV